MDSFRVERGMVRASCSTTQVSGTMVIGSMTREMVKPMRSLPTAVSFRASICKTKCMGRENTVTPMDRPTTESGKITSSMELDCGSVLKATHTWASGKREQPQVLGYSRKITRVDTRGHSPPLSSMGKAHRSL